MEAIFSTLRVKKPPSKLSLYRNGPFLISFIRFMPASTPAFGIPKVALVMARLMDKGEDLGCRYFIVPIW